MKQKLLKFIIKNKLNLEYLSIFETQFEKEKNLNIMNLAIYEKVIINYIYVILIIRKYKNNL